MKKLKGSLKEVFQWPASTNTNTNTSAHTHLNDTAGVNLNYVRQLQYILGE